MRILRIFRKHRDKIIKIPGVISVGLNGDKIAVKIDDKNFLNKFVNSIEGVLVEVELEESRKIILVDK